MAAERPTAGKTLPAQRRAEGSTRLAVMLIVAPTLTLMYSGMHTSKAAAQMRGGGIAGAVPRDRTRFLLFRRQ